MARHQEKSTTNYIPLLQLYALMSYCSNSKINCQLHTVQMQHIINFNVFRKTNNTNLQNASRLADAKHVHQPSCMQKFQEIYASE